VVVSINSPLKRADKEHNPEGESPEATIGHVPLIHPVVCQIPLGALKPGPLVSST
jgi:hypothetical protein